MVAHGLSGLAINGEFPRGRKKKPHFIGFLGNEELTKDGGKRERERRSHHLFQENSGEEGLPRNVKCKEGLGRALRGRGSRWGYERS